jgi:hypothetical protein
VETVHLVEVPVVLVELVLMCLVANEMTHLLWTET